MNIFDYTNDVVKYLLEKGADVNQCNKYKETSLQRAYYNGHHTVVRYLVQKGAHIHQCDTNNMYPLYKVFKGGWKAVVEFLVDKGADDKRFSTE